MCTLYADDEAILERITRARAKLIPQSLPSNPRFILDSIDHNMYMKREYGIIYVGTFEFNEFFNIKKTVRMKTREKSCESGEVFGFFRITRMIGKGIENL